MKTKIIATISPKLVGHTETYKQMLFSGVNIIRINLKYTTIEGFEKMREKTLRIKPETKILADIKKRSVLQKLKNKKFDYLAISFAELPSEIKNIKKMFPRAKIISKIETKKGVMNIDNLIKGSDGIMIARGDLGEQINIEKLPIIQKLITKKCNKKKKMSITATEIMPSMVHNKRPTRAEVSDIANAILEGADALLLAEETAIGKYPALTVQTMKKIILEIERSKRKV